MIQIMSVGPIVLLYIKFRLWFTNVI